ncbi:unnamed protein product [Schistocephalus solidus]|uniref:C2H2-type domain-containing protein n=1 Tax=Schistocephalus solidus TaxID=70667 RepID=A0A3P7EI56_SCHSO|nr:unnamed protein product [Schistocephalus solidus]
MLYPHHHSSHLKSPMRSRPPNLLPATPASFTATTSTVTTCFTPTTAVATSDHLPSASSTTNTVPTTSGGVSVLTCPHWDRTFTSRIGLSGHLQITRSKTGKSVSGAPTHSRHCHLQCTRAFTHCMGLPCHMRIHESGIHCDADTPYMSCASIPTPTKFTM